MLEHVPCVSSGSNLFADASPATSPAVAHWGRWTNPGARDPSPGGSVGDLVATDAVLARIEPDEAEAVD